MYSRSPEGSFGAVLSLLFNWNNSTVAAFNPFAPENLTGSVHSALNISSAFPVLLAVAAIIQITWSLFVGS